MAAARCHWGCTEMDNAAPPACLAILCTRNRPLRNQHTGDRDFLRLSSDVGHYAREQAIVAVHYKRHLVLVRKVLVLRAYGASCCPARPEWATSITEVSILRLFACRSKVGSSAPVSTFRWGLSDVCRPADQIERQQGDMDGVRDMHASEQRQANRVQTSLGFMSQM